MSAFASLAVLAAVSFAATLAAGRPLIAFLRARSLRQHAYEDAPERHAAKSGTPTMGGVLFLGALVLAALWHPDRATSAVALAGLGCGAIGALDDLRKIAGRRNRGLRAGPKLALTAVVAVLVLLFANHGLPPDVHGALLRLGELTVHAPLPLWFALGVLALVATAHGVNLTDGLDGLAAGTMLPPLAVVAVLAWRSGIPGVAFADAALAASVLGFLAFNRHPASVFMGDTGSLALGAALATSAVLAGESLLLPLVGGVFAAEALSVIVQVAYFKKTHKRIFRMSPLHHHFELGGLAETTVTHRFWTASALLSLAGLALAR